MKQTVLLNFFSNQNLSSKTGFGNNSEKSGFVTKSKFILAFVAAFLSFAAMAQTYTTKAAGSWSSASTWVGGVVPGNTIGASQTVNIKHAVQYSQQSALTIAGTLNITGDSLTFDSNFNKGVTIQSTGILNVTNGGFIQDVTANKADLEMTGGRIVATNARIVISKGMNATQGAARTYTNSTIQVCEKYEFDGTPALPTIDTIKNSTVQVAMNHDGDFHIKSDAALFVDNAKITVGNSSNNGNFNNDANGTVTVLPGAANNFGFNLLKVQHDLHNDGTWNARIDTYCVTNNVNGSKATDIDFTRPEDCSATATSAPAPELSFTAPVLKSGIDKKQGAIYRFSNITPGVDAEIKLKKFSRPDIVMNTVDNSVLGWNKAFQPEFGLPGLVAPYQNWYIDFTMTFYKAGTNTKTKVQRADFTALDVDGDGYSIAEYASFSNPSGIVYSTFSSLGTAPAGGLGSLMTCPVCGVASTLVQCLVCHGTGSVAGIDCIACDGDGVLYSSCSHPYEGIIGNVLQGPIQNYSNIDTSSTAVMATFQYMDVDHIDFRYGATSSGGASNGSGIRLNSLWSKSFNLTPISILPVNFSEFSAEYQKGDGVISWKTPNAGTLDHFVVQRSTNGKNFSDIALVFTGNAGSYSYRDKDISSATGVVYYRVVSVDQTKETLYTDIKLVRLTAGQAQTLALASYPNPVVNDLHVTIPAAWQGKAVGMEIYTLSGVRVKSLQFSSANQTETLRLNALPTGLYTVKAVCGQETAAQRILKN